MTDEIMNTTIEVIPTIMESDPNDGTTSATEVEPSEGESTTSESTAPEEKEPVEPKEQSLDDAPLPGDEPAETKKTLPKWVDKKLSRKDQEIAQRTAEAEAYRAEVLRLQALQTNPTFNSGIDPNAPKRADFAEEAQFIAASVKHDLKREAAAAQQAAQLEAQQSGAKAQENRFYNGWENLKEEGLKKYDDFHKCISILDSNDFPNNRAMAEAILESEHKVDLYKFLAENEEKAREIALMNPVQAVKRIADIERRFDARKQSQTSKAPPAIGSINTNQPKGDTIGTVEDLIKNSSKLSQADFEKKFKELSNQGGEWS